MAPSAAILLYTRLCVEAQGLGDDTIVPSMVQHGCLPELALEVARLVPVAFGRQFLSGMGISFSDAYWLFSDDGDVEERRTLSSNAVYMEAVNLAPSLMSKAVVSTIVFRSSEADAVNTALNNGSKPANLRLAPVAIFYGQPTDTGLQRAQEQITASLRDWPASEGKKPWWKLR